jgi:hypothetical protein
LNPHLIPRLGQELRHVIPSLAMSHDDSLPNDVETLKSMLVAERAARMAAEGEAQHRALLIDKLKYTIRKLRHERFGQSSERGTLLDQLELQLADLEEDAAQAEATAGMASSSAGEIADDPSGMRVGTSASESLRMTTPGQVAYRTPDSCQQIRASEVSLIDSNRSQSVTATSPALEDATVSRFDCARSSCHLRHLCACAGSGPFAAALTDSGEF